MISEEPSLIIDKLVCCCGRPKAEFIDSLEGARGLQVLMQVGDRDENVTPELIQKGVDPLIDAGLDVEVRRYDAQHQVVPEMAVDAAAFASEDSRA